MDTSQIVTAIDSEIANLREVRNLLTGQDGHVARRGPGRPAGTPAKKRTMSAEGRARIAAAQRARWAKLKRTAKKAA